MREKEYIEREATIKKLNEIGGEDLSKFRFYERKQNDNISGMIQSLQNSNTNCRRKSTWR